MRIHLTSRPPSARRSLIATLIAAAVGLAIAAILIAIAGANPLTGFIVMAKAAFVGKIALTETLAKAAPLVFTGLAALVALRVNFWNIGGEGQLLVGAMAAAFVGALTSIPAPLLIPAMIVSAMASGGLLALLAAVLKSRFQVNEAVCTLMLNFIITYVMLALLSGPWRDPISNWTDSPDILPAAEWPNFWRGTHLHLGVLLAIAAAFMIAALVRRTTFGFAMDVVGNNPVAARHAGIRVEKTVLVAALVSGALAGLAGAGEVGGIQYQAMNSISPGYGYTGLIVAMLARLSPMATLPCALFLAGLMTGSDEMSRQLGVPSFLSDAVQGLTLLAVLIASQLSRYTVSISWQSRRQPA